jgi:hypothetical protein
MNEKALDESIRKFLKNVGVNSHQAIVRAIEAAEEKGALAGNEMFPVRMTLEMPSLQVTVQFDGEIES